MVRDIKKIIGEMTLEEKAGLCSGLDNWNTKAVERLGIPSIMMTDGPHGLRKMVEDDNLTDIRNSVPATCFPTAAGMACSWDRELMQRIGVALGEECQAEDVSILLGPGVNIKRSPLCGRNFEYFSEDPYITSEMATNHVSGVQSQGVGVALKHFCANNQEYRRLTVNACVDERTLREIYLACFEGVVKRSKPWTLMCAYNRVNGEYAAENKYLLTDILRNEWGLDGFVMSDWGAVNERVKGLEAGLELEMPYSGPLRDKQIEKAVIDGQLSHETLDTAVERLLNVIFKAIDNKKANATFDKDAHHKLAREASRECMVLLKNADNILPLKRQGTIALIGAFAKQPRAQGDGSSHVIPIYMSNAYQAIMDTRGNAEIVYSQGYESDSDKVDEVLIDEAVKVASNSDIAVVFAGLIESYESEGYDRKHLRMPENHVRLIQAVASVQKNVVVVLSNGSPVEMPWLGDVKAVLETYLGGQAVGEATADILFGDFCPCGKLAETFPMQLSHNPSYLNFPGYNNIAEYREGLFVGYRYYDAKDIQPLFPFGFGLSYTSFEYSDLRVNKNEMTDEEILEVSVKVKNTGCFKGKEIVQLYVRDIEKSVIRPDKELKGFEKVELDIGEEKIISFKLDKRAFAYYNTDVSDWVVEGGEFELLIAKSSNQIAASEIVTVKPTTTIKKTFNMETLVGEIMEYPGGLEKLNIIMHDYLKKLGMDRGPKYMKQNMENEMLLYTPLRSVHIFSGNSVSYESVVELIDSLNN